MINTTASLERDVFHMENAARHPGTGSGENLQANGTYAVEPRVIGDARRHAHFFFAHAAYGDDILTMETARSNSTPWASPSDAHGRGGEGNFTQLLPLDQEVPLPSWNIARDGWANPVTPGTLRFSPLNQKIRFPSWNFMREGWANPVTSGILNADDVTITRMFEEVRDILDESRVRVSIEADRRLRELRELELGWDGCDGVPIAEKVIRTTEYVLIESRDQVVSQINDPYISPLTDGGIDLEWVTASGAELLLTIHSPEEITYLLDILARDGSVEESEGRVPQDSSLVDLFSKIT